MTSGVHICSVPTFVFSMSSNDSLSHCNCGSVHIYNLWASIFCLNNKCSKKPNKTRSKWEKQCMHVFYKNKNNERIWEGDFCKIGVLGGFCSVMFCSPRKLYVFLWKFENFLPGKSDLFFYFVKFLPVLISFYSRCSFSHDPLNNLTCSF